MKCLAEMSDKEFRTWVKRGMLGWFYDHYEDATENTPVEGGEFVFLFGEPDEPDVILHAQFGDIFKEDFINDVAGEIDDQVQWVKNADYLLELGLLR